jgi:U3 small nucleolar RNA-associated protein 24
MGKTKKTRKFAVAKKVISPKDNRVLANAEKAKKKQEEEKKKMEEPRQVEQAVSALFFQYNTQLGPPYHVLIDTNFINFSIRKKLDIVRAMCDCLLAKCIPCITDCVMGELEKLGGKYKIALRLAKDPRFERIPCSCKGCYADDCLTKMAQQWRCFIVATCDKELRGRIRKIPGMFRTGFPKTVSLIPNLTFFSFVSCVFLVKGVPCMYISGYRYAVERMPE